MRGIWSCGSCMLLLLSAVLPAGTAAMHQDRVHKVGKVHAVIQYERRGTASVCPAEHSLCPASLDGGCCPDGYACAASSCYATTAATASACGKAGYFACGADVGGGCCPADYVCGISDCTAPAGVTYSQNCPLGYYLCPSSYNYGCCQTGYGCAPDACYATAPLSYVFTYTTTADDGAAETVTSTGVTTPTAPSGLPTSDTVAAFPKFIPTTVGKVPATASPSPSDDGSSHGLSAAQLGGIVGGAVALLLAVILAAFLILRRLRSTVRAVESSGGGGGGGPPAAMAQLGSRPRFRPTTSEVDAMDVDPLMEQPAVASSLGYPGRSRSASELPSSQGVGTTSLPTRGSGSGAESSRAATSYFDIPRVHNVPGRHAGSVAGGSADPQRQYAYAPVRQQHGRHWSDASQLSAASKDGSGADGSGAGSPPMPAELDVAGGFVPELPGADAEGPAGRRPPTSVAGPYGAALRAASSSPGGAAGRPPLGAAQQRRRSEGRGGDGSSGAMPQAAGGLNAVDEASELGHGHHGPQDAAAGQTAAGLGAHQEANNSATPQSGR